MKWITTTDIVQWAPKRNCQDTLPQLIRKLVRATAGTINQIHFPSGENVLIGGWDGILEIAEGTEFIPQGMSAWEFGTSEDCKGKADKDYQKRSTDPLGINPTETTFVFVTPRNWTKGDDWITEKKKDGKWKDIKVINAAILEEWLETAPTVSEWLAAVHLRKPSIDIQSTDVFWDRWSTGPHINIFPSLLIGGREEVSERLTLSIKSPSLLAIKSSSQEESLAFIIASFKNDTVHEEDFFARSLIVEQSGVFRQLTAISEPLILLPLFEDDGSFQYAVRNGHTVIVPLGADSANINGQIPLGPINRESFVENLMQSGLTRERASKLAKESARNVTVLRRQLEFVNNLPEWAKVENVREIIPALLVGRWDENFDDDKQILAEVSGESYEEYLKKITKWLNKPDSPLIKIGTNWRLTSPLDAWIKVMQNLTENDFRLLSNCFLKVLKELNPAFELLPDQRPFAEAHGKRRQYSNWIREGLCQSIIMVSIYGAKLSQTLPNSGVNWAETNIRNLLDTSNPLLWKSLGNKLPLLAEAAPVEFMSIVEKHINSSPSPIATLFAEEPGLIIPRSFHTGLLDALEGLAWFPHYLSKSSLLLTELAAVDPGGTISNRPSKSLFEIFVPWHYQTRANYEERIAVLNLIAKKQPSMAWVLFKSLLPPGQGYAMGTHKMRWRAFSEDFEQRIPFEELRTSHTTIISLVLSVFDDSEEKLSELIVISRHLNSTDRDLVLNFIESKINKIQHSENQAWNTLRGILYFGRSRERQSLPEEILERYAQIYTALTPEDDFQKISWIFEKDFPEFPEGLDLSLKYEERAQKVFDQRNQIIKELYQKGSAEKIYAFADTLNETWILGGTFGNIISEDDLFDLLLNELPLPKLSPFVKHLLIRRSINFDFEYTIGLYEKLKKSGLNDSSLAKFLIPSKQSSDLWKFINKTSPQIEKEYWLEVQPNFWGLSQEEKNEGIKHLIEVGRYHTAIHTVGLETYDKIDFPSELLTELLVKAATKPSSETVGFREYEVKHIIETLSERGDVEEKTMISIEWNYLSLLIDVTTSGAPKILSEALSSDPDFFIEIVKWAYKPDDEQLLKDEIKDIDSDLIARRGYQAWELLHSWNKIPGIDENGNLNANYLKDWVKQVRTLADSHSRLEIVDLHIGKLLARIPYSEEPDEHWPPIAICEILEEINSQSILSNYSSELFNIHGFSARGVFDGGTIERGKANHYSTLANKHRNQFPIIASVFENLAKGYENDAIRMDQRAEKDELDY